MIFSEIIMNTIWIVMPILIVLMFLLGIDLNKKAFTNIAKKPKAIMLGVLGQIVLLPVIGFIVASTLRYFPLPCKPFMKAHPILPVRYGSSP